jgi:hypothetical protein
MKDNFDNEDSLSLDDIDADLDLNSSNAHNMFSQTPTTDAMKQDDEQPMSEFMNEVFSRVDTEEKPDNSFQKIVQFPEVSIKKMKPRTYTKRDLAIQAYCLQKKNY